MAKSASKALQALNSPLQGSTDLRHKQYYLQVFFPDEIEVSRLSRNSAPPHVAQYAFLELQIKLPSLHNFPSLGIGRATGGGTIHLWR